MGNSFEGGLRSSRESVQRSLDQASTEQEVSRIRIDYLGRKGRLTLLLRRLQELPPEERSRAGKQANALKAELEREITGALLRFREETRQKSLTRERIDITLPGTHLPLGRLHPITQAMAQIVDIFTKMGFQVAEGP